MTKIWLIGGHTFVDTLIEEEVVYRWLALCGGYRNDTMNHLRHCIVGNETFDLSLNIDNAVIYARV
jgi:hypothetical protein